MTPLRLTRPTVGLIPTMPPAGGRRDDRAVGLRADRHRAEVGGDGHARSGARPGRRAIERVRVAALTARPLQPLDEWVERKFAHSERFALPRSTAPAARSRSTRNASRGGVTPASASEPAVLCIRSRVATLSFTSTGMPCSGPRGPFALRSASSAAACPSASGLASSTDRSAGPFRSSSSIRWRYAVTSEARGVLPRLEACLQPGDGRLLELERR